MQKSSTETYINALIDFRSIISIAEQDMSCQMICKIPEGLYLC